VGSVLRRFAWTSAPSRVLRGGGIGGGRVGGQRDGTTRGRPGFEASQATRERIVESWGVESVPRRFAAHLRLGLLAEALELRHGATRRKNAREIDVSRAADFSRFERETKLEESAAAHTGAEGRETYELTFSRSFK